MKSKLLIFLKGILMGICDIIPGISGGTIAFITGIYDRLINAVKNFSFRLVIDFFKYVFKGDSEGWTRFREDFRKLDLGFLIVLFLGIATAFLLMSRVITFLLDNYFAFAIAFFVGLILASSKVIFSHIEKHHTKNVLFGFIGFAIGLLFSVLVPIKITPSIFNVFFGGFLAVSAMFLPGISGAFILLILGLYEFMLGVLKNLTGQFNFFIVFILGAILGALFISKVIAFLFRENKSRTLYVLLGLVVGALSIPIRRVYESNIAWNFFNILIIVILFVLGVFIVEIVGRLERKIVTP